MKKGFTLVELLIVIGIIAILAGLVLVTLGMGGLRAKVALAKTQISNLNIALEKYNEEVGFYPIGDFGDEGIANIVEALSGKTRAEGGGGGPSSPYWEFKEKDLVNVAGGKAYVDPWKKPWQYSRATDANNIVKADVHMKNSYDLYSFGPDGKDDHGENDKRATPPTDDINNWTGE